MRNKTFIVILTMVIFGVLSVGSVFGQFDIIWFTFGPPTDLYTADPTVPVTWQATIQNISIQWWAENIGVGFNFLNPSPGIGTVTFASGLPTVLAPQQIWQGNFASFDFFDWVPIGSTQEIEFLVYGDVMNTGKSFITKYQTGTATLVPEPSSVLLLATSMFGFVVYEVIRRKKKA